jgi:hypothetical protein
VNRLKYEFQVAPGADPERIRLRYRGVTSLTTTESGALRVETPAGVFEDAPPEAWQEIEGRRVPVAAAFSCEAHSGDECHRFRIRTGRFDRTRALVLDPAMFVYCGYVGGEIDDACEAVAVDASGNAYVTGWTTSMQSSFPVKVGPDLILAGWSDAFVAKIEAGGTGLVYCGYVGGKEPFAEQGRGLAVDASGNAYVAGMTTCNENEFPVKVGPDVSFNGGYNGDGYVAKVGLVLLEGGGGARPGSKTSFALTASDSPALPYQLGTSLGTGPIAIDTRQLDLSPDDLLLVTVNGYWPWIFSGYRGVIDSKGQAQAAIHIPNIPALIGTHLHTAFVTLDPAAPSGIRSISKTFSFQITK